MAAHEFELIEGFRRLALPHPRVSVGIGDDAAVLRFPVPALALVTTDLLMEGVDFLLESTPLPEPSLADLPRATPEQVGRKALAVSLSDIAAMAGQPLAAFTSVALPRHGGAELGRRVQAGLQALADEFGVAVAGGDTNSWDGPLVINTTVVGEATERGPVPRGGARPGDWIMVTGTLGGSLLGHHLDFTPRVREAMALHRDGELHAMIDLSDGLAGDLRHILEQSGMGAELWAPRIPISAAAVVAAERDGRTPLEHALGDGEDFELLLTVSAEAGRQLLASPVTGAPLSHIGLVIEGSGCTLVDDQGARRPLPAGGWVHRLDE